MYCQPQTVGADSEEVRGAAASALVCVLAMCAAGAANEPETEARAMVSPKMTRVSIVILSYVDRSL
jgi:hypothetical protein